MGGVTAEQYFFKSDTGLLMKKPLTLYRNYSGARVARKPKQAKAHFGGDIASLGVT